MVPQRARHGGDHGGCRCGLAEFHALADPVYEGHPLSVWVRALGPESSPIAGKPEAEEAIRHFGTNAIPMLLKMIRAEDSDAMLNFTALAQGQHIVAFDYTTAEEKRSAAALGFGVLGISASNAVPELIRLFNPTNSENSQYAIVFSLSAIGSPARSAIPLLVASMKTNQFESVRMVSVSALCAMRSEAGTVVPALTRFLEDPNMDSRAKMSAALGLPKFGMQARLAVPALVEMLEDSNAGVRTYAQVALSAIFHQPEWARLAHGAIKEPKLETVVRVINGFGAMGTNAAPAVPALLKFLADSDEGVRVSATNALRAIEQEEAARAGVR